MRHYLAIPVLLFSAFLIDCSDDSPSGPKSDQWPKGENTIQGSIQYRPPDESDFYVDKWDKSLEYMTLTVYDTNDYDPPVATKCLTIHPDSVMYSQSLSFVFDHLPDGIFDLVFDGSDHLADKRSGIALSESVSESIDYTPILSLNEDAHLMKYPIYNPLSTYFSVKANYDSLDVFQIVKTGDFEILTSSKIQGNTYYQVSGGEYHHPNERFYKLAHDFRVDIMFPDIEFSIRKEME